VGLHRKTESPDIFINIRASLDSLRSFNHHLPGSTTSTVKVPGLTVGRGRGLSAVFSGVGPNSAVGKYILCVSALTEIVLAPACVGTVASTLNVFGFSSCTTVRTPSPHEL
jgi:hypothetical protein